MKTWLFKYMTKKEYEAMDREAGDTSGWTYEQAKQHVEKHTV